MNIPHLRIPHLRLQNRAQFAVTGKQQRARMFCAHRLKRLQQGLRLLLRNQLAGKQDARAFANNAEAFAQLEALAPE